MRTTTLPPGHHLTSAHRPAAIVHQSCIQRGGKLRPRVALVLAWIALALLALTPSSRATLLLTDDFTGYTGNLDGNTGGSPSGTWTKGGSGPSATIASTTALTYPSYNGGGGNYVLMPTPSGTTSRIYKGFTSTASAGNTFYVSFLLNLTAATATGDYFITLGDPTTGTTYGPRIFAKTSGTGFVLGVSKQSNTATYGTTVLAFNTTHLVVMRLDGITGTSNDGVYLWANPSLLSEPATGSAECSVSSGTDPASNIGNFIWHNRSTSNPSGAFDGVRVAAASTSAIAWSDLAASSASVAPTVTTQAASSPATDGATLNGTVVSNGGASLTDRGFYWSATSPVTTSSTQLSEGGTSVAAFSKALSGQSVNTIYYYRAYGINSVGTGIGSSDVSFYTAANTPAAPTVGNPTMGSLDVTVGASDGNPSITTYAMKEAGGQFVQAGGLLGASAVYQTASVWGTRTVTGLSPSTAYSFTVQAKNGDGVTTSFGPSAGATTSAGSIAPSVTTQAASSLSTSGATMNGTVTADNGAAIIDRGFYWSINTPVTTSDTQVSAGGTAVGVFSAALSSLSVNTRYYYRAYATNSIGLTLDISDVSFYTLASTPTAPLVNNPGSTTLSVAISSDDNPAQTLYAIQETTTGKYVQTSGALGATAAYQIAILWSTKTVTGLTNGTTYTFQVKAQNDAGTDTAFGPTASGTTTTPMAAWDLTGEDTVATSAAEVFNANLDSANTITRGAGAPASIGGNSFRTTQFQNNGISTANTDYFQATLSAAPGYTMSLTSIDARFAGTSSFFLTPGVSAQFAYSLDGTTFTLIGSPFSMTAQGSMPQIPLSTITDLQNVPPSTTVYIRYYASGQTTTGGWGFNSPAAGSYGLEFGGTVTGCTPPAVPGSPSATSACGKVSLGWTASSGASSYNIYRSMTSGTYGAPTYTGVSTTSYDDTGAAPGTPYYYKITALSAGGCESALTASTEVSAGSTTPAITLGSNPATCLGTTSASLSYSAAIGSPDKYSIDFDITAEGQGFADVTLAALPGGNITIAVPAGAAAGTYNATLTVKNNTTGCVSAGYPITVTVNAFVLGGTTSTIFSENMGVPASTTDVTTYTGWQNSAPILFGSTTGLHPDVRTTTPSGTYTGASGGGNVFFSSSTGAREFVIAGINTVGFSSLQLQFGLKLESSVPADPLVVEVSPDGTTYSALTFTMPTSTTSWGLITPTGTIPATSNLRIRFSKNTTASYRIDDVTLTGVMLVAGSAAITTPDPTTFCAGGSATLNASAGGTHYSWLKNGAAAPGATDSATYLATVTGNYTVAITDLNGCSSTSSATTVTVNDCSSLASVTISSISGTTLTYGGGTGSQFVLLKSTSLATQLSGWERVATNVPPATTFTIPAVGTGTSVFYSIKSE